MSTSLKHLGLSVIYFCLVYILTTSVHFSSKFSYVQALPACENATACNIECVIPKIDRHFPGAVTELNLQIHPDATVSQTHGDYVFEFGFNKTLEVELGDSVYAQVNFTNFFRAAGLSIVPE